MRAMDSNKKKVMDRRVKEHQKVFRPRNKDVNAMKAMKVTMLSQKMPVSRSELHKALIQYIKFAYLKTNMQYPSDILVHYPSDAKQYELSGLWIDLKNNSVNEKWHRK